MAFPPPSPHWAVRLPGLRLAIKPILLDEIITTAPNTKSGFTFAFTPVGPPVHSSGWLRRAG